PRQDASVSQMIERFDLDFYYRFSVLVLLKAAIAQFAHAILRHYKKVCFSEFRSHRHFVQPQWQIRIGGDERAYPLDVIRKRFENMHLASASQGQHSSEKTPVATNIEAYITRVR